MLKATTKLPFHFDRWTSSYYISAEPLADSVWLSFPIKKFNFTWVLQQQNVVCRGMANNGDANVNTDITTFLIFPKCSSNKNGNQVQSWSCCQALASTEWCWWPQPMWALCPPSPSPAQPQSWAVPGPEHPPSCRAHRAVPSQGTTTAHCSWGSRAAATASPDICSSSLEPWSCFHWKRLLNSFKITKFINQLCKAQQLLKSRPASPCKGNEAQGAKKQQLRDAKA